MAESTSLGAKTVVLVHGGFVDGSGWEGVYNILRKDGYTVASRTIMRVTRRQTAATDLPITQSSASQIS
jgi:hypothetical protein